MKHAIQDVGAFVDKLMATLDMWEEDVGFRVVNEKLHKVIE